MVSFFELQRPYSHPRFCFDYSRQFRFSLAFSEWLSPPQLFFVVRSPFGSLLRLEVLSTWGSSPFAALDRLQILDPLGRAIPSSDLRVFSDPQPLDANGEPHNREIRGLVSGHCLSPLRPAAPWRIRCAERFAASVHGSASLLQRPCSLFVLFDVPVVIGLVRVGAAQRCEVGVELRCGGGVARAEGADLARQPEDLRGRAQLQEGRGWRVAGHSVCGRRRDDGARDGRGRRGVMRPSCRERRLNKAKRICIFVVLFLSVCFALLFLFVVPLMLWKSPPIV